MGLCWENNSAILETHTDCVRNISNDNCAFASIQYTFYRIDIQYELVARNDGMESTPAILTGKEKHQQYADKVEKATRSTAICHLPIALAK